MRANKMVRTRVMHIRIRWWAGWYLWSKINIV